MSVGFVAGLDYHDPLFDPHLAFQRFKQHPLVAELLAGGQMVRYGAKALPEGGWYSVPQCHMNGALIVGDAAGVPQFPSAQGDPSSHAERGVRRRGGVRGGPR